MNERSGFPSMTALLGLLAIAGYQNRDKIAEMLKNMTGGGAASPGDASAPALPGGLGGLLAGTSVGGLLTNGLNEMMDKFNQAGQKDTGRFLDRHRTQQGRGASGSEGGSRTGRDLGTGARHRHERTGPARQAVARIAASGRQIYPDRSHPAGVRSPEKTMD